MMVATRTADDGNIAQQIEERTFLKRADVIWMGVLALAFALLVGPLLATGRSGKSEMSDEVKYHLPVIVTFASELPRPDLKHYRVAMTPAWHLTMATMYRLLGGDLVAIRVLNAVFGLAVVLLIYGMARQFVAGPLAAALAAPVLASNYLIGASSALTTDNAAWAGALATLWCAVLLRPTVMSVVLAGVGATWTVLVRQVFIWLVAPIRARGDVRNTPGEVRSNALCDRTSRAIVGRFSSPAVLGVAAATGAVAAFLLIWGGLVPDHPEMTSHFERGFNGASFAFAFTLAGMSGVCLLPLALGAGASPADCRCRVVDLAAGGLGLIASLRDGMAIAVAARWGSCGTSWRRWGS